MALRQLVLLDVRLMFAQGLTERSVSKQGEDPSKPYNGKKYNAKFAVEKGSENDKKVRKAIEEMAVEQWKDKAQKVLANLYSDKAFVYRDGDKLDSKGFAGHMYLAPTNHFEPEEDQGIKFLPAHSNKLEDRIADKLAVKKLFYSGCRVNLIVNLYSKDNGLFGFIKTVQFWRNDERLEGGGVDTSELPTANYGAVEPDEEAPFSFEGV